MIYHFSRHQHTTIFPQSDRTQDSKSPTVSSLTTKNTKLPSGPDPPRPGAKWYTKEKIVTVHCLHNCQLPGGNWPTIRPIIIVCPRQTINYTIVLRYQRPEKERHSGRQRGDVFHEITAETPFPTISPNLRTYQEGSNWRQTRGFYCKSQLRLELIC